MTETPAANSPSRLPTTSRGRYSRWRRETVWQSVEPLSRTRSLRQLALPEGDGTRRDGQRRHGRALLPAVARRSGTLSSVRERIHRRPPLYPLREPAGRGTREANTRRASASHGRQTSHDHLRSRSANLTIIRTETGSGLHTGDQRIAGRRRPAPGQCSRGGRTLRLPSGLAAANGAGHRKRTVIDLPNPTEAWFFANGSSFQGPVTLSV